jgi:hypothetical protein
MNVLPEERPHQQSSKPEVQCLPSLCRGLYHRVAQKVGCDPSYVSRVARGERTSQAVSEALRAEIQLAWSKATEYANGARMEAASEASSESKDTNGATSRFSKRKAKAVSA